MAAPQTGLTSCQTGDMGHPVTVRGNPRHIPLVKYSEWSQRLYSKIAISGLEIKTFLGGHAPTPP